MSNICWPRRILVARAGLIIRVAEDGDFMVLENLEAWPRAFFSDKVAANSSTEEFIKQLVENGKQPFVSLSQGEIEKQPGFHALENTPESNHIAGDQLSAASQFNGV